MEKQQQPDHTIEPVTHVGFEVIRMEGGQEIIGTMEWGKAKTKAGTGEGRASSRNSIQERKKVQAERRAREKGQKVCVSRLIFQTS